MNPIGENAMTGKHTIKSTNGDAPSIEVETITVDIAAHLLGTMNGNRSLRQRVVQRYAREMIAGQWLLNGEAIKISRTGRLIDGQHRLNALLMAKIPVKMYVVRGVDDSAMITLDTGVNRSFYDVGVIAGDPHARGVGSIARWWYRYESSFPVSNLTATHQELKQMIIAHPAIVDSAGFVGRHQTLKSRCTPSVQGFVHAYATEKYDRDYADTFMQDLNDGAKLGKTDPIYLLRKRLIESASVRRLESSHVLALTIKAWNAWLDGEKMQTLVWRTGGPTPEAFPRFGIDEPKMNSDRKRMRASRIAKQGRTP